MSDTGNPSVTLQPTPGRFADAKSLALFDVTGDGVYNPGFPHRIFRMGEFLVMEAQPPNNVTDADYRAGTVAIGDTITVDGETYVVTARDGDDPELIPANR